MSRDNLGRGASRLYFSAPEADKRREAERLAALEALGEGENTKGRKTKKTPEALVTKPALVSSGTPQSDGGIKYQRPPIRTNQRSEGPTGRIVTADSVRVLNDTPHRPVKEAEITHVPQEEKFDVNYAFLKDFFDNDFSAIKFEDLFPPREEKRREDQTEGEFKAWLEHLEDGRIKLEWVMANLKEAGKNNPVIFEVLKKITKEIYDFIKKYRSDFKESDSEYHYQSPEQMATRYLRYVVQGGGPRTNLATEWYIEEIDNARQAGNSDEISKRTERLDEVAIDHLWDSLSKGCVIVDQDLPKSASYEWHGLIRQISQDIDTLTASRLERKRAA